MPGVSPSPSGGRDPRAPKLGSEAQGLYHRQERRALALPMAAAHVVRDLAGCLVKQGFQPPVDGCTELDVEACPAVLVLAPSESPQNRPAFASEELCKWEAQASNQAGRFTRREGPCNEVPSWRKGVAAESSTKRDPMAKRIAFRKDDCSESTPRSASRLCCLFA